MGLVTWTETRRIDLAKLTSKQRAEVQRAATASQGQKMKVLAHLDRTLPNANSTEDGGIVIDRSIKIE